MLKLLRNKKLRIIIILSVVILIILLAKLSSTPYVEETEILPTPTTISVPTTFPTITSEPELEGVGTPNFYEKIKPKILESYPLFDHIPYKTDFYLIDYLDPLILEVILKQDTPETRKEVLDWISTKGVDPESHTIIWKTQ